MYFTILKGSIVNNTKRKITGQKNTGECKQNINHKIFIYLIYKRVLKLMDIRTKYKNKNGGKRYEQEFDIKSQKKGIEMVLK